MGGVTHAKFCAEFCLHTIDSGFGVCYNNTNVG